MAQPVSSFDRRARPDIPAIALPNLPQPRHVDMVESRLRKAMQNDGEAMCRLFARVIDHYVSYSLVPMPRRPWMDQALDEMLARISLEVDETRTVDAPDQCQALPTCTYSVSSSGPQA